MIPARVGLAPIAAAAAAGIAISDRAGHLSDRPAVWAAMAALTLAAAWHRPWRRVAALLCGFCAAATLAAADRADLAVARARLEPWLDDSREETLSGTVAAPVEDDGHSLRFALDLTPDEPSVEAGPSHAGTDGDRSAPGGPGGVAGGASHAGTDGDRAGPGGQGGVDRVVGAHPARVLVSVFRDPDDPAWTPPILPGDEIEVTGGLRTPRGFRVPGAPPPDRAAAARGAVAMLSTDAARVSLRAAGGALDPWRIAARMQRRSARRISEVDRDGVLRALVTGDTSAMSERDAARYRDSGASHVLAVSGLHLAAVALFAFVGMRRLWASIPALVLRVDSTRAAALFAAPAAVGYTLMTGAAPSAVRALWMVLLVLVGAAFDRRARAADALGGAAIIMLAARPAALFDPSLQLSFAATSALAVFMAGRSTGERGGLRRVWRWLRDLVVASLWTWAATAPISAVHFGVVALAGPIANLVAVPAVELIALPLGLAGAVLAELWPDGGAAVLAAAAALIGRVTGALGRVAEWIPPLRVPAPVPLELAAWAVLLGAAAAWRTWRDHRRAALAAGAIAALVLLGSWWWRVDLAPRWRDELRVAFVDVGQGDAAVVELPGGGVWLIDAGGLPFALPMRDPDAARRLIESPGEAVVRYLAHRGIRRIDLAILSHAHPDHFRGLGPIGRSVPIGELWLARPHEDAPTGGELSRLLAELTSRGTRVRWPRAGQVVNTGGASLTVLAPGAAEDDPTGVASADPVRSENDNSLVVRVDFAGRRILFPGDLEEEGEEDLVRDRGAEVDVDVVKVPHHGSRTSSTAELVAATSPTWVIISCGRLNRFGFPNPSVVERWRAAGAMVFRTDQSGTLTAIVAADGGMRIEAVDRAP
jgi:competence protein ComEC